MNDLFECPHCGFWISTKDWADEGMYDFKTWEEECEKCEKTFEVVATIEVRFDLLRSK